MTNDIIGTGVAFPLRVDHRGAIELVSNERDIEEAIRLILMTAPGERMMRPEFGCRLHEYIFDAIDSTTTGRIEDDVRTSLARWEPRIEVTDIDFDLSDVDRGALHIGIGYTVRVTNERRNLVYPLYIIPAEEPQ